MSDVSDLLALAVVLLRIVVQAPLLVVLVRVALQQLHARVQPDDDDDDDGGVVMTSQGQKSGAETGRYIIHRCIGRECVRLDYTR